MVSNKITEFCGTITPFPDLATAVIYAELDQFKLFNAEGTAGGLTASYIPKDPSKEKIVRTEPILNYEFIPQLKNFPQDFDLNNSRVVWEGEIESEESGNYHFYLHYAGYVTVYLNNEVVVKERWRTAWNPNDYKFVCNIEAGKRIPIRVEWEPDGSVSYMALKALSPLPEAEQNKLSFWSEMGNEIDYYFVYGKDMDEVISGYRTLTGKSQIMPKWAMGFWQSRERYKTQYELVNTLKEFRSRKIGIDNIVQDWFYWPEEEWGSHKFDPKRFPNPEAMVDSVHLLNAKIMISVWPKFYAATEHYKQFDAKGWMYRQAVKDSIRDWVGKVTSVHFTMLIQRSTQAFLETNGKNLIKSFDAWWMDASEPNIQDNTEIEYRKKLAARLRSVPLQSISTPCFGQCAIHL